MALRPFQLLNGERPLTKQPFERRHIEHDDKPAGTELFIQRSAHLFRKIQLRRLYRRIARKHHLAVDTIGIWHLQRLLRRLDVRFDPLVGIGVRKLDENLRFAAGHYAHVYDFIAPREGDAHGQTVHLAETHRLGRLLPGLRMENPIRVGSFRPCRILMQRTVVPTMDEIRPLGAVLQLGTGEHPNFPCSRPVAFGPLPHFGEKLLRFRRGYPGTSYGVLARSRRDQTANKHCGQRQ